MWTLWKKSFRESRWLLLGAGVTLMAFLWMRVWVVGQLPTSRFLAILRLRPAFVEKLSPVPWDELASTLGRLAAGYNEAIVVLILTAWSIGRGSDAVAGEVGRGSMEMLLAQPVRRITVLAAQATMTLLGAVALAAAAWAGTMLGVATVKLEDPIDGAVFAPAVLNLLALAVFLAGMSTLASALSRYRGRVIGFMCAVYVFATVARIISRVNDYWTWLKYLSFFTAFEPTLVVLREDRAWCFFLRDAQEGFLLGGLGYSGLLVGLGALGYLLAAIVFCHRDLPAPL